MINYLQKAMFLHFLYIEILTLPNENFSPTMQLKSITNYKNVYKFPNEI